MDKKAVLLETLKYFMRGSCSSRTPGVIKNRDSWIKGAKGFFCPLGKKTKY